MTARERRVDITAGSPGLKIKVLEPYDGKLSRTVLNFRS